MVRVEGSPTRDFEAHSPRFDLAQIEREFNIEEIKVSIESPKKVTDKTHDERNSAECDSFFNEMLDNDTVIATPFCWLHPEVRKNWRTVLAAGLLFVLGIALISLSLYALTSTIYTSQGVNFFVVGLLCFIPGSYHVLYIWLAARGYPGYDFQNLQVFA